jgi:hypothetical protein
VSATKQVGHTPGPWAPMESWPDNVVPALHVTRSLGCSIYPKQDAEYATVIALCCGSDYADEFPNRIGHQEAEANARLIAAAPELLAALQGIVAEFDEWAGPEEPGDSPGAIARNERVRIYESARAVIAKAGAQ